MIFLKRILPSDILENHTMLSWLYQALLSFVARVLSWFGISFGTNDVANAVETVQTLQQGSGQASDEPHDAQESVQAYSG